jgi:dTDP-4-dehydrorhamnose 3,5-epimerase
MFQVEKTPFDGVLSVEGTKFVDNRGWFMESFKDEICKVLGVDSFVQDNQSFSKLGVIRGLHWQNTPMAQGKLIQCLSGKIFDVVVDVRKKSKDFGKHIHFTLSEDDSKSLWIPEGFAHGFQSLSNNTLIQYKVTNYWAPKYEMGINPLDPALGILWPQKKCYLSEKDSASAKLAEIPGFI